jgi:hypothetical protein
MATSFQRVQMNFIISDNMANCLKRAEKSVVLISFWWCPLWSPRLYCCCFLPWFNMNQVPETLFSALFRQFAILSEIIKFICTRCETGQKSLLPVSKVHHESGTRKTISLSVIAYNKKLRVVPCSGETKSYFYALVFPQVS